MSFEEEIQAFSEYSRGKSNHECSLKYEDIRIENFNFTRYELNDSEFLGVKLILIQYIVRVRISVEVNLLTVYLLIMTFKKQHGIILRPITLLFII